MKPAKDFPEIDFLKYLFIFYFLFQYQNSKIYLLNTDIINFVGEKITKCIIKRIIHLHRKFNLVLTYVRSVEQFIVIAKKIL